MGNLKLEKGAKWARLELPISLPLRVKLKLLWYSLMRRKKSDLIFSCYIQETCGGKARAIVDEVKVK